MLEGCPVGLGGGVGVAEHRDRGIGEGHRVQGGGETGRRPGHERGMEGAAHGQGDGALACQRSAHLGHGLRRSGEHHLGAAVVVGDHHAVMAGHQGVQLGAIEAHHGCHRPAAGLGHQGAAGLDQPQARGEVEHPGCIERHQLPQAVAGHQIGRAALGPQPVHQQALQHVEGRLGVAGAVQVGVSSCSAALADGQQVAPHQG